MPIIATLSRALTKSLWHRKRLHQCPSAPGRDAEKIASELHNHDTRASSAATRNTHHDSGTVLRDDEVGLLTGSRSRSHTRRGSVKKILREKLANLRRKQHDRGRWTQVRGDEGVGNGGVSQAEVVTMIATTGSGARLPPELLLNVIEQLLGDPVPDAPSIEWQGETYERWTSWLKRDERGLSRVALVCREWFRCCAPLLYSKLRVDIARVDALCACLREVGNSLTDHARLVKIYGRQSWLASSKLSKLLPRVTLFFCKDIEGERTTTYHHAHSRVIAGRSVASANIKALALMHQTFSSARDLLYILGALPSLTIVSLEGISFISTSAVVPRMKATRVRCIETKQCEHAWPLAGFWTWAHKADDSVGRFAGLLVSEMRIVATILRCINNRGGQQFHLDSSPSQPRTCKAPLLLEI